MISLGLNFAFICFPKDYSLQRRCIRFLSAIKFGALNGDQLFNKFAANKAICRIGQNFFDLLPVSANTLDVLRLWGGNGMCSNLNEVQLSLEFVGWFPDLKCFTFHHQVLSLKSLISLSRWLGKFDWCQFDLQDPVYIEKDRGKVGAT